MAKPNLQQYSPSIYYVHIGTNSSQCVCMFPRSIQYYVTQCTTKYKLPSLWESSELPEVEEIVYESADISPPQLWLRHPAAAF